METINCIFCNIVSDHVVIEESGYQGRKCPKCDLIYISPRPSLSEIITMYSKSKVTQYAESIISGNILKRLIAGNTLKLITKYIKTGAILEIGAGAGYFLDEAREKGFKVFGIELNPVEANFIVNTFKIPCENSSFNSSSFHGKTFDIIYHSNVISHFYDPATEFKKMNSRLKNNGILVFETGNLGDVDRKYYKLYPQFGYPDHLFFLSKKSIEHLMQKTGFELLEFHQFSKLPLLLKGKLFDSVKGLKKGNMKESMQGSVSIENKRERTESNQSKFLKKANIYLTYFLIYKLGYVLPKKGRPQTMIVIARKK